MVDGGLSVLPGSGARLLPVPDALRSCVAHAYVIESADGHAAWTLPDAAIDLFVSLGDVRGVFVAGPQRAAGRHVTRGRVHLIGVSLRPGAGALLGPRAAELSSPGWQSLADISPAATRVLDRSSDHAEALFGFLAERLSRSAPDERVLRAVLLASRGADRPSVPSMAKAAGASERTLHRLFEQHVGLSPVELIRVARFQRALRALADDGQPLRDIAHATGFSDQAHMTREMVSLAGAAPTHLRRLLGADGAAHAASPAL